MTKPQTIASTETPNAALDVAINEAMQIHNRLKTGVDGIDQGMQLQYDTERNARMYAAMSFVQDNANWKNPIDIVVDQIDEDQMELITDAVVHYTGSVPNFEPQANGKVHITADGYYMTIGS